MTPKHIYYLKTVFIYVEHREIVANVTVRLIYYYWSLSLILHGGAESSQSLWLCLNCPIYYSPIIFAESSSIDNVTEVDRAVQAEQ